MKLEEAKYILSGLRPADFEPSNEPIAQAVEMLESNPELAEWYSQTQRFDDTIREQLTDLSVPNDLKANILSGVNLRQSKSHKRKLSLGILACAATLLTLSVVVWIVTGFNEASRISLAGFHHDMLTELDLVDSVDYHSNQPGEVAEFLQQQNAPGDVVIPANLMGRELIGCKILKWQGKKVTMFCFSLAESGQGVDLHIMLTGTSLIPELAENKVSEITNPNWVSAAWVQGENVWVVASKDVEITNRIKFQPII